MQTAQSKFSEIDLTYGAARIAQGIKAVIGETKRGPINDATILVSSWEQFRKLYGGLSSSNLFPLLCKRALDGGAALRVVNVRHYSDPTDASTLTAVKATQNQSKLFVLSASLAAGHTIDFTLGSSVSQVYATSSLNTLNLLAAKIKAAFSNVDSVVVIGATSFAVSFTTGTPDPTVSVTGTSAPTVAESAVSTFTNKVGVSTELFSFSPKYAGADYNNIRITVGPASSGDTSAFDLTIEMVGEADMTETYRNLKILGAPTVVNSHYLDVVKKSSQLVNVTYKDLSSLTDLPIVPNTMVLRLSGGTDGSAIVDADYIGSSSSKIGIYALDGIDDTIDFAIPNKDSSTVHISASSYAAARKDINYLAYISKDLITPSSIVSYKRGININSSYTQWFHGGLTVPDPVTGEEVNIPMMGDLLAVIANSDRKFGEHYSYAGQRRGLINNAIKPTTNFGASGNLEDLNYFAANQINTVIANAGKIMVWGNFTAQQEESQLSYTNVRRLLIAIKKSLAPLVNLYLEEPNDPTTWKQLYMDAKPYLDGLEAKRAIYGEANWQGDQFAKADLSDLVINRAEDVQLGKYRVRLFIKAVPSLQEIGIEITLTPSSVSFEDIA